MTETKGYFGQFGGSFVPEPIQNLLNQLEETFEQYKNDPEFIAEYKHYLKDYSGRETPLYFAESLTDHLGGAKIYLKREDLNHLGSHKLNNVLGQILLAKRMGKTRVIAETGAGQHGVATAAAAAKFGMACDVYMGAEDVERQRLNVFRMEMMGATVHAVETGTKTLKDAVDAAFGAWMADLDAFYVLGSAVGPHPYPTIVHEFQKVISEESKRQILEKEGRLPDYVIACVGGGSNAIGAFSEYVAEEEVGLRRSLIFNGDDVTLFYLSHGSHPQMMLGVAKHIDSDIVVGRTTQFGVDMTTKRCRRNSIGLAH